MRLLIVRHAAAEERDTARWPDDRLRPLTSRGAERFRDLLTAVGPPDPPIDQLLSSRFVRAWETALILHRMWITPPPETEQALEECGTDVMIALLQRVASTATVRARSSTRGLTLAIVGHEPDLGALATLLVTGLVSGGSGVAAFRMRKGAIVSLRLDNGIHPGRAEVEWMIDPKLRPGS